MIVEFIGTTGAGKTTLIASLHERLAGLTRVRSAYEVVSAPLGLRRLRNPSLRNLVQELLGFPFFVSSFWRRRSYLFFVLKMLSRQARFSLFTLNILRSLERKLGVYEMIRGESCDEIVLVDEGTILTAHNIFVFNEAAYSAQEIARFAQLVPLPDLIIYIKAPVETLVRRSLERRDPPREIRSRDPSLVTRYVKRAVDMFDCLVQAERLGSRIFVVENCDSQATGQQQLVDEIIEFIMGFKQRSECV